jgi:all-trans-8'-apo-beta-carotenal 15,15'-oxygenase
VYIHDWFVTPRFFALLLHPAYLDPGRLLRVLVGRETFATALAWHPERGSLLQVAERGGSATWTCEMEPCWMWHAINAFDAGPELVLDFIGGDMGGGLGDETSPLFAIMRGEQVVMPPEPVNYPRRCRVNLSSGKIAQQVIDASANFELPGMSATERGLRYRKAYMIKSGAGELFARSLCQLDGESLETCSYQFPPGEFCGEPVVCDSIDGSRSRSIVTQVYSAETKTSYFAVFDERQFESGPVARVQLRHHVPLSFHGYWSAHSGAPQGKAPRNGAAMSPGARLRT